MIGRCAVRLLQTAAAKLPLLLMVLSAVGLAACSGTSVTSDVAATVGEVDITTAEVDEAYERRTASSGGASEEPAGGDDDAAKAIVLTNLIRSEILRQAAEERGIEITDEDIAQQRDLLVEQLGGEDAFEAAIEQANLTDEELETNLRDQAIQVEIVAELAEVVDENAVREAFENDPQGRYGPKVEVRHILTETRPEAREAIERIESGEDFAEVAGDVSIDPGSAQNGGDLGEIGRGQTVPPFDEAAFDATVGELVGPVKSDFGFHVLEVTDKIAAPELADVEDQIRSELEAQSGGPAFAEFISGFIADLGIDVDERYGRWDDNAVAIVPLDAGSEAPALPSDAPELPSDAP